MNQTIQWLIVGLLITGSLIVVTRAALKTIRGTKEGSCNSGCGKCSTSVEDKSTNRISLPTVRNN